MHLKNKCSAKKKISRLVTVNIKSEKKQINPTFLHFTEVRVVLYIISAYWDHCTSLQDTVNATERLAQERYLSHNRYRCNNDS